MGNEVPILKEEEKPPPATLPAVQADQIRTFDLSKVGGAFWTSVKTRDHAGKALIQRALVTQDEKVDGRSPFEWSTVDLLAHDVTIVDDKTGEINQGTRLVLIGPDGKTLSTVSDGAISSLRNIVQLFGQPPWKPALVLVFNRQKTRRGFFTYNVTVKPEAKAK